MGSMKDMLLDLGNEDEDLFDEEEDYTDQEDDYDAQCAQLMDIVKKSNQNTEALLAMLQKKSDEVDALLKERGAQQSGASAQWEYGAYGPDGKLQTGRFTYYNSLDAYIPSSNASLFDLGKQGWEAYSTIFDDRASVRTILMKRRIQ